MPYCALSDLLALVPEARIIELTDDDGLGVVDLAKADAAIAAADAEIDGYLASRYSVPLTAPAPDIVRILSADLALYHLYGRTMDEPPKIRQSRYESAVRKLRALADGSETLGIPSPPEETGGAGEADFTSAEGVFGRDGARR